MSARRVNPFTIEGLQVVVKRNAYRAILSVFAALLVAQILYLRTEGVYRSETKVLIPSSYIASLASEQGTQALPDAELGFYRIALVRSLFSDSFLDALGERFDLFTYALDEPKHSLERQALRVKFQISSDAASAVTIAITGRTPEEASGLLADTLKELREVLFRKLEDAGNFTEGTVLSILSEPTVPEEPLSPHRRDFLAAGLAVGFLIALLQLLYMEYRLSKFLFPEEVASTLGVEFMGELPEMPRIQWIYLIDHVKAVKIKLLSVP